MIWPETSHSRPERCDDDDDDDVLSRRENHEQPRTRPGRVRGGRRFRTARGDPSAMGYHASSSAGEPSTSSSSSMSRSHVRCQQRHAAHRPSPVISTRSPKRVKATPPNRPLSACTSAASNTSCSSASSRLVFDADLGPSHRSRLKSPWRSPAWVGDREPRRKREGTVPMVRLYRACETSRLIMLVITYSSHKGFRTFLCRIHLRSQKHRTRQQGQGHHWLPSLHSPPRLLAMIMVIGRLHRLISTLPHYHILIFSWLRLLLAEQFSVKRLEQVNRTRTTSGKSP